MIATRLTSRFSLTVPILLAPMSTFADARLAAAVTNAEQPRLLDIALDRNPVAGRVGHYLPSEVKLRACYQSPASFLKGVPHRAYSRAQMFPLRKRP